MLAVKNYTKFQHFKDRRPPWIKLYRDLLDDLEWHDLEPKAAKALVMLWLIASENEGKLPEVKKLAFRLRLTDIEMSHLLNKLSHWLVQDDDKLISLCHQVDTPETETETEEEREKEVEAETDNGATAPGVSSPIQEVFAYWQAILNHPQAKLTPERKKKIEARLNQGYTVTQIQTAIDGCRASPYHQGQNDNGTVYDDIELICRNGTKLESFIAKHTNGHIKKPQVGASQPVVEVPDEEANAFMDTQIETLIAEGDFMRLGREYDSIVRRGGAKLPWEIRCVAEYELHKNELTTTEVL